MIAEVLVNGLLVCIVASAAVVAVFALVHLWMGGRSRK